MCESRTTTAHGSLGLHVHIPTAVYPARHGEGPPRGRSLPHRTNGQRGTLRGARVHRPRVFVPKGGGGGTLCGSTRCPILGSCRARTRSFCSIRTNRCVLTPPESVGGDPALNALGATSSTFSDTRMGYLLREWLARPTPRRLLATIPRGSADGHTLCVRHRGGHWPPYF